jgi:hypothetical protein
VDERLKEVEELVRAWATPSPRQMRLEGRRTSPDARGLIGRQAGGARFGMVDHVQPPSAGSEGPMPSANRQSAGSDSLVVTDSPPIYSSENP